MHAVLAGTDVKEPPFLNGLEQTQNVGIARAVNEFRTGHRQRQAGALGKRQRQLFPFALGGLVHVRRRMWPRLVGGRILDRAEHARAADVHKSFHASRLGRHQDVQRAIDVQVTISRIRYRCATQHPRQVIDCFYTVQCLGQGVGQQRVAQDDLHIQALQS